MTAAAITADRRREKVVRARRALRGNCRTGTRKEIDRQTRVTMTKNFKQSGAGGFAKNLWLAAAAYPPAHRAAYGRHGAAFPRPGPRCVERI